MYLCPDAFSLHSFQSSFAAHQATAKDTIGGPQPGSPLLPLDSMAIPHECWILPPPESTSPQRDTAEVRHAWATVSQVGVYLKDTVMAYLNSFPGVCASEVDTTGEPMKRARECIVSELEGCP